MVKGMENDSLFSFTTTRGHTTHISLLWVFVLFSFLCVAVVLLAGYQKGLQKREFPDTKVNGDLEVTGDFKGVGQQYFRLVDPVALTATADTATNLSTITQPANTLLTSLHLFNTGGDITTGGTAGDDLNIAIGTAQGGGQILAATALMDDGGAAVTWQDTSSVRLDLENGMLANAFANGSSGITTTAAIEPVDSLLYTSTERTIFVTLTPLQANLAATSTAVRAGATFVQIA